MATRIQVRRGSTSDWNTANPILNEGEIGYNITLGAIKVGDGSSVWADLEYLVDAASLSTSLGSYVLDTDKSAINGVAELDASKNILAPASIIFEGTANDHETTLAVTDPTADRTITFPDATGTVALTTDITVTASSTNTLSNKSISLGSNTVTSTLAQLNTAISDADVATLAGTETLTNKTLTSPVINTPTGITKTDIGLANVDNTSDANKPVSTATQTALDLKANLANPTFTGTVNAAALTLSGDLTVNGTTTTVNSTTVNVSNAFVFEGTANDFETTLTITDPTADRTITLPDSTGTVALTSDITVTPSSTNTLTNKTLTSPKINEDVAVTATATELNYVDGVTSAIQTQLDDKSTASKTETLTNKSISLGSNTVTSTLAQLNSAVTDADLATLAGTETLTNKTLTTPTINGGEFTATGGTPRIHGIYLPDSHFITFEGATNNEFETVLTVADPTADRTITLPDATGTLLSTADFTAKGTLLIGTANGTFATKTVGTNGKVLTADSSQADGVIWADAAGGGADLNMIIMGAFI
jgi:hypothetical protein